MGFVERNGLAPQLKFFPLTAGCLGNALNWGRCGSSPGSPLRRELSSSSSLKLRYEDTIVRALVTTGALSMAAERGRSALLTIGNRMMIAARDEGKRARRNGNRKSTEPVNQREKPEPKERVANDW